MGKEEQRKRREQLTGTSFQYQRVGHCERSQREQEKQRHGKTGAELRGGKLDGKR